MSNNTNLTADSLQSVARPVVMLSKEYEQGYCSGPHFHPRTQLLFARSGTMIARTGSGSWVVPSGFGLIIPPGAKHDVELLSQVSLRSAYIQPDVLPDGYSGNCSIIRISPLLAACIERFSAFPPEYGSSDIAGELATIIAAEVAQSAPSPLTLPYPPSSQFGPVFDTLAEDPASPKSIDDWACELGLSRRSFTRAFRQDTGMSFDTWRQRLRYLTAAELISTGLPPYRVAPRVGYGSVAALLAMMARHS